MPSGELRLSLAITLALGACEGNTEEPKPKVDTPKAETKPKRKVDTLTMTLPGGWTSSYDAGSDKWLFTSPPIPDGRTSGAIFERAPAESVASPEALRHYLETRYWDKGTTAEIESRAATSDGFATTFVVKAAADPAHPKRETYVMKEIGSEWFRCFSPWVVDNEMRDQVLALCKSIKAPK